MDEQTKNNQHDNATAEKFALLKIYLFILRWCGQVGMWKQEEYLKEEMEVEDENIVNAPFNLIPYPPPTWITTILHWNFAIQWHVMVIDAKPGRRASRKRSCRLLWEDTGTEIIIIILWGCERLFKDHAKAQWARWLLWVVGWWLWFGKVETIRQQWFRLMNIMNN